MTNNIFSAIDMAQYGINMIVLTEHSNIDKSIKTLKRDITKGLPYGLTKEILYKKLLIKLKSEDNYFTKNVNASYSEKQRWQEFNDDCIIYAALDHILTANTVHLVHPSQYSGKSENTIVNTAQNLKPTIINGIPSFHSKTILH